MKEIWTYNIYLPKNNLPEGRLEWSDVKYSKLLYVFIRHARSPLRKRPMFFSFSITQHQPRGGREKLVPVASGIRTHTKSGLSRLPLPLGYRDLRKGTFVPFQHNYYIGNCEESQLSFFQDFLMRTKIPARESSPM